MTLRQRIVYTFSLVGLLIWGFLMAQDSQTATPQQVERWFREGQFREAYDVMRLRCATPATPAAEVVREIPWAIQCLERLNQLAEADAFLEATAQAQAERWPALAAVADAYVSLAPYGFEIAGQFQRGPHRGGGQYVDVSERDRARALKLLAAALPLVAREPDATAVGQFHLQLARTLLHRRADQESWRLQSLTDLQSLPDAEQPYFGRGRGSAAPVNPDGSPVFYEPAESWEVARHDGQRWRWALAQAAEFDPKLASETVALRAHFLQSQFGVETLADSYQFLRSADSKSESAIYALDSLTDQETIARLASGIQRLTLPDDHNPVKLFQSLAETGAAPHRESALDRLAEIFENRRQFARAAEYWRASIDQFGLTNRRWKQDRLDQILGNWGQFEAAPQQSAGKAASFTFTFRNARQVTFTAQSIDVARLLKDTQAYLKAAPRQLDHGRIDLGAIGMRLIHQKQQQYVDAEVTRWEQRLEPRPGHRDETLTVDCPFHKPGAYLVTAQVADGNTAHIVLWVADTAIVHKPLDGRPLYFIGDAANGTPVPRARVEFFGFNVDYSNRNRPLVRTTSFTAVTDSNGLAFPEPSRIPDGLQWLVTARTDDGRLAYLGFQGIWRAEQHDARYNEIKTYGITDRPVYRPGQQVQFKFWIHRTQYDQPERSEFAGGMFDVELNDPQGERVQTWQLKADEFGGLHETVELAPDAKLGDYWLNVVNHHGVRFRVEEYKRPEFEVTVEPPTKPTRLGDQIAARIQAKYYFGSPVTAGTVHYKVERTTAAADWYPMRPWDWCFGPGYWWFGYDYDWYPGWRNWRGCVRPMPWWWPMSQDPPEIVAEGDAVLDANGSFALVIDTKLAAELRGDSDHRYSITAEVRDASRRTITGAGEVLVARQPFQVFAWLDRGHYRVGDPIEAHFLAQTVSHEPVATTGDITLYRITYDQQRQPVETPVLTWPAAAQEDGLVRQALSASAAGQYRLKYAATAAGTTIDGGYVFTVTGPGFDGREFRFNQLELVPDRAEYAPGEKVRLSINTDRADSTVLLFLRPTDGVYLPPRVLRLEGKSTIAEIDVTARDMPNFFVEAVTIADGKLYDEAKQIVVPPVKRVLNVDVLPSAETLKPGETAQIRLKLTELDGRPFVGSTVVAVYDKSLEYISGGGNVPDIKEYFWKWQRTHHPTTTDNLGDESHNITPPNTVGMSPIGVFGHSDRMLRKAMRGMVAYSAAPEGLAAPMAAAAESADTARLDGVRGGMGGAATLGGAGGEVNLVQPALRSNFAETALWVAALTTNERGEAETPLTMPESLTTWRVKVWALGHGARVGSGESEIVTRKNLILRPQMPRFVVERDELVFSAVVHNYLAADKQVTVRIDLPAEQFELRDEATRVVTVPRDGEVRVDWRARAVREGLAEVRMSALTDEESDAVQLELPCQVHGFLKTESWAGTVRRDQSSATVAFRVPRERRPEQTLLEVQFSPSLAAAMIDAIPYLASYPYGCTEQTLNRFLPAVLTQRVVRRMGLDLEAIRQQRTNLNAQELGPPAERAQQWQRFAGDPVFDNRELDRMVKSSVQLLVEMQLNDGGWGWFGGYGERSDAHLTSLVVHGLQIAVANDVAVPPGVLDNGIAWLQRYRAEQIRLLQTTDPDKPRKGHADNLDAFVQLVLVEAGHDAPELSELLYRDRLELSVYAQAMLGLVLDRIGDQARLAMVLRNLSQFVVQDLQNETAYLRMGDQHGWWYWYGSEIEAQAYYLKLLARCEPQSDVAPRLVKYLLNNRKHATYWNSTRDTAICLEAFSDYLQATGEERPEMTVEIWLDGRKVKETTVTASNLFSLDNRLVLTGETVTAGEHQLELRRTGSGPVYFNAYLTNFSLEDSIAAAGLEVKIDRRYFRLESVDKQTAVAGQQGQVVDQAVEKYNRIPLGDLSETASGDLVEVELVVESKNDYEYILIEDRKPAGCEPVEVQSGYLHRGLSAYVEYRDAHVALFLRTLARGTHSLTYRLRAETPGTFSALPARAFGMYAPELTGNSDELRLKIADQPRP